MTDAILKFAGRCLWCGQVSNDLREMKHRPEYNGVVVPTHSPIRACEEHQELVHDYLLEVARRSGRSLVMLIVVLLVIVGGGVVGKAEIMAAGLLLGGVWAIWFPYASPLTVRRLGVINAKFAARWIGGLLLVGGTVWLVSIAAGVSLE